LRDTPRKARNPRPFFAGFFIPLAFDFSSFLTARAMPISKSDEQQFLDWELEWPLRHSDVPAVLALFAQGANPNTPHLVASPLSWSMTCKSDEMALAIYEAGGRLRPHETREAALPFHAANKGLPGFLRRLLADGEKVEDNERANGLDRVLFLRDAKDWTPAALEAWTTLLRAHSAPESLLIHAYSGNHSFYGMSPPLLIPGSESGLKAFLGECLSRKRPPEDETLFSSGLVFALNAAIDVSSQETVEMLFLARKKLTTPTHDGVGSLSAALGDVAEKAMRLGRPPELIRALLAQWSALADFSAFGPRLREAAIPRIWSGWLSADTALQPAYLSLMLEVDFPLRARQLDDGSHFSKMGPWVALVGELSDTREFVSRPNRIEKVKNTAQMLLAAGALPHPAALHGYPSFEPLAAAAWLAGQDRKLWGAWAESEEHVRKIAQKPPGKDIAPPPEPMQWLFATLEALALRQSIARPIAHSPVHSPAHPARSALDGLAAPATDIAPKSARRV